MSSIDEDAVITLNVLIETCKDGELGFRTAADDTRNAEAQRMFLTLARERAELTAELQREVQRLGGTPAAAGSVSGSLHRGWMNLTTPPPTGVAPSAPTSPPRSAAKTLQRAPSNGRCASLCRRQHGRWWNDSTPAFARRTTA
jgi:hypothetical protein